jgi:arsenic resistance protein ArsH
MLYSLIQRVPWTLRPAVSSRTFLLRPKFSERMFSAVPQQVIANTCQTDVPYRSLALSPSEDAADIRQKYRPFILGDDATEDWVNKLDLATALDMAGHNLRVTNERLKVLVLYGSLRRRSYSRLVALEASRILFRLGCDVRVFDPEGLPVKNDSDTDHPKVRELRELSLWSDGHVWVSREQHGNLVSNLPR